MLTENRLSTLPKLKTYRGTAKHQSPFSPCGVTARPLNWREIERKREKVSQRFSLF
jgi:hypothetical protein